jgi:hypothetical protein
VRAPDFMETVANTSSVEIDLWRRLAWQSEAVVRLTSGPHLPEAEETKTGKWPPPSATR